MIEAILLVGGQGTRLRPLTIKTPKPLLPIAGVPFLEHQLAQARAAGIDRVVFATSYRAELFEQVFGDGSALGLSLEYVTEAEPLGTGGAIRNASTALKSGPDDPVVIFNGDILSGHDLRGQLAAHRRAIADVTLHLTEVEDARPFGCVPVDADGRVIAFLEKMDRPVTNLINAGCYVFRRAVIDSIPSGQVVSVERQTFPRLLEEGADVRGFVERAYWLDLGTPQAFVRGSRDLVLGKLPSPALPAPAGDRICLPESEVDRDAAVTGGSVVGRRARVAAGALVDGSVILDGAIIAEDAVVRDSVVGVNAQIGAGAVLDDAYVGDGADIGQRVELRAGARVWCDVTLPPSAVRFSSDL